jgi:UrcA family protein
MKLISVFLMMMIAFMSMANAATYHQVTVSIADIDLTTDAGQHDLMRRLSAAAREVCPKPDSRDGSRFHSTYSCERAAVKNALRYIGAESVLVHQ